MPNMVGNKKKSRAMLIQQEVAVSKSLETSSRMAFGTTQGGGSTTMRRDGKESKQRLIKIIKRIKTPLDSPEDDHRAQPGKSKDRAVGGK